MPILASLNATIRSKSPFSIGELFSIISEFTVGRLRDCVFDSRSKIPRSGDFSRVLESTLGPVLRLISDLELTLGRRLRQSAALVPAEPSLLT